jgi:hypothetical protein
MRKSKVQPLIPFIGGRLQILQLLFMRQGIPLSLAALVAPDIIRLGKQVQADVADCNAKESPVASSVIGRII